MKHKYRTNEQARRTAQTITDADWGHKSFFQEISLNHFAGTFAIYDL
ncbi:MAG: hypothetical protein WKF68_00120 [Daejeonella sp.]